MSLEQQRYMVGRGNVVNSNDLIRLDLTEHGDLVCGGLYEWLEAAACNLEGVSSLLAISSAGQSHEIRA